MIGRGRVLSTLADELVLSHGGELAFVLAPGHHARPGDLVSIFETPSGGLEVRAVHRSARGEWPPSLGEPGHDLGRLTPEHWQRLRLRADILRQTRAWFDRQGFLEVETPLLVPSPGTETHLDPVAARLTPEPGAAPETRWLITSPEYAMKRLLAGGAPPIWQLCKVFRDGERGRNHRPEFSILEWYRPWVDGYGCLMEDCEGLLNHLVDEVAGRGAKLRWRGRDYDLSPPWPRLRFFDLLRERADIAHPEELDVDRWLAALVDRVEPTLGLERPEFLCEWPIEMASLSRRAPHDPRVAERFELYLGTLELGNAFAELTDASEQRARCVADNAERRGSNKVELPLDEDFLGALEAGLPPSAGIAMGFDRLVMVLTDARSIGDVLTF